MRDIAPAPDPSRCQEVWKRSEQLFEKQRRFLPYWQALAEIFYPERGDFTTQQSDALERYEGIYDGEPQLMRRDLASDLGAISRPRGRDWFFLRAADDRVQKSHAVKMWTDESSRRTRNVLYTNASNFSVSMAETDHDYTTFGNAVARVTENRAGTGLLFQTAHLRDCAWAVNDEGAVAELCERSQLPIGQIARLFGRDKLPRGMKDLLEKSPHEERYIRRCVAPVDRDAYPAGGKPPTNAAFCSYYILEDGMAPLGEGFWRVFPYWVRRWLTVSGEDYGRSMAAGVALRDARTLNVAQMSILKSVEWAVDPPKAAKDDSLIGEVRLQAGAITYYSSDYDDGKGPPIKNIETGDPRQGHDFVDRRHAFLARAFFRDRLRRLPEKEMTAYEAGQWIEQFSQDAAPVVEPIESDHGRLMDTVFERCQSRNLYDEPPEELRGQNVQFEFDTLLTQARRKLNVQRAKQAKMSIGEWQQLDPSIADNVDMDVIARDEMEGIGPTAWLVDPEIVAQRREQRAQAQDEAANEQRMTQMADLAARAKPETLQMLQQALAGAEQGGEAAPEQMASM